MSTSQWREDIIILGSLGRKVPDRVEQFNQVTDENGVYRLEGTQAGAASKRYIMEQMRKAGLEVRIDYIGNIFARKAGSIPSLGSVVSGSHLDSVPNGGMFDGAVGVVGALEAVRRMNAEGFRNRRPIEVAVFLDEEGSSFKHGLLGSSVLIGRRSLSEALNLKNDQGCTLREALEKENLRGEFAMDLDSVEYFVEMHVEQGPVLDTERIPLGIVENITGMTWLAATVEGQANHAGTTPMSVRCDPLVAACEIPQFVEEQARALVRERGGSTTATVGRMVTHPGVVNIIPGLVELAVDIRDGNAGVMSALRDRVVQRLKALERTRNVRCKVEVTVERLPSTCASEVIASIEESARELGIGFRKMNSGAAHDAQNMAERVKAGMLFVPSVGGLSHSPREWTHWEDIEKGIEVLTRTLRKLSES